MKNFRTLVVALTGVIVAFHGLMPQAVAQTNNGIYADFTTSVGNFSCALDYSNAPITTANFIGLATGQRPWLNPSNGQISTNPFYNGQIFFRIVKSAFIEAGSPSGSGADGPGYIIPDEFSPNLIHDGPGVLGMDNAGAATNDTAGSQFYITMDNDPNRNGHYAIFGRVTNGMSVVTAINQLDSNSVPVTNVVIQNITIRRQGTAAQNFDINAQNLPVISHPPLALNRQSNQFVVILTNTLNSDNFFRSSASLSNWSGNDFGLILDPPPAITNIAESYNPVTPALFYQVTRVQYPIIAPYAVTNRIIAMLFDPPYGDLTLTFDAVGTGTYTSTNSSSGTILSYSWVHNVYHGNIPLIQYSGLVDMALLFNFTNTTGGTITGEIEPQSSPTPISGTFTITGP